MALKATGAQLAAVLENARLLMDLQRMCSIPERPVCNLGFIKGQRVSGGFARARAVVWGKSHAQLWPVESDRTIAAAWPISAGR
jgi:phosphotransferase system enzyme I (PtsP)